VENLTLTIDQTYTKNTASFESKICDKRERMVERTMSLGVGVNKETMRAQQELLQKITHELDAEREASSTAASEALSMILRLQGEKAALEMEASQYKRMSEEKMCHAETSLTLFEDLIYRKEMEMASLEFQKGVESSSLSPRQDLSACWEEIRRIDDHVREVSESRDVAKGSKWSLLRCGSISHALVSNTVLESAKSDVSSIMEMIKNPERFSASDEVPRTKESLTIISEERNVGGKMVSSDYKRKVSKPPKDTSIEAEHMSLLKEIREQISEMQSEMRNLNCIKLDLCPIARRIEPLTQSKSLGVGGNGETMRAQQELLKKITHELDAEREASSSAASEAVSMILRLQEEKAALEMEASHYNRMAEEKMCHAETSLTLFEDLIYRKEMEMASRVSGVESGSLSPRQDLSACWEEIRRIDDHVREMIKNPERFSASDEVPRTKESLTIISEERNVSHRF
ncbi:LOW QUALITY PROTEIN: hypothetical protein HID58_009163, partial [Brassica napus]